jgi:uncharacterized protein (TIGR04552 family)
MVGMTQPTHSSKVAQAMDLSETIPPQTLADLAALRILLTGESVVDQTRWWFPDRAAVDDFLRLLGYDTDNSLDVARLEDLHHEAVTYLADIHRYRLPASIESPNEIHDLFLLASGPISRDQRLACMVLKVMHISNHVAGRELVFNLPISEAQLFARINARVFAVIDKMRASGIGVQEFAAGKKSRASMVTKLLAKRGTLAASIFDKVRFRIVVNSREDLVSSLLYLLHYLVPFNYVVPEQSQNGLLLLEDIAKVLKVPLVVVRHVFGLPEKEGLEPVDTRNEFSGPDYRIVNFVVDLPLRVDDIAPEQIPAVAFVAAEIQLVDVEAAKSNEQGANAHTLYKKRQRERVKQRLEGPGGDL